MTTVGDMARKRVAIVGSGCAGLGAAWALQSTDYEVHVFEQADRLGGHTNTQIWKHGDRSTPVDTGFIVMNSATYRQLPSCRRTHALLTHHSQSYQVPPRG